MPVKKSNAGRPPEMTDDKLNKLAEVFALDGTVLEACYYADITKQTYYNWLEKNPHLVDRFQRLKQKPFLKARQTIVKNLDTPQWAFEYMKRKKRKEFGDKAEVGITGDGLLALFDAISKRRKTKAP